MFIEKIQDPRLRQRLEAIRDRFPRNPDNGKPMRNHEAAEAMRGIIREDDMVCLPPDTVIPKNRRSAEALEQTRPSRIVEHLIARASHHCIVDFCFCREIMFCRKYRTGLGCLLLGDAARNIHPELGRTVDAGQALAHAHDAMTAGLFICLGRSWLDNLWLDMKPGEKTLTICNTCSCCCLTRLAPHAGPDPARTFSGLPGLRMIVNDYCIGCATCVGIDVCLFQAIRMRDGRAHINDGCRFCGRCIRECPVSAIELIIEDDGFVDRAIENLNRFIAAP